MFKHASLVTCALLLVASLIPSVAEAQPSVQGLCNEHFLEHPVKVDSNSPDIRKLLAQEVLRKRAEQYAKHWRTQVFYDGATVRAFSIIDGLKELKELGSSNEQFRQQVLARINADVKAMFVNAPKTDVRVSVDRTGGAGEVLALSSANINPKYLTQADGISTLNPQAIWLEVINAAGALKFVIDNKATSFNKEGEDFRGRTRTIPGVQVNAEGFVYRYFSEVELNSIRSNIVSLHFNTFAECRRGADNSWRTIKIADYIHARFDFKHERYGVQEVFSISPLYKAVHERLTK